MTAHIKHNNGNVFMNLYITKARKKNKRSISIYVLKQTC